MLGGVEVNGINGRQGDPLRIVGAAIAVASEVPMWILMYVFSYSVSPAATNDRSVGQNSDGAITVRTETNWRITPPAQSALQP